MSDLTTVSQSPAVAVCLRWAARALSVLALLFLAALLVGEGAGLARLTGRELSLFLLFPVGVTVGIALGWRWELLGGAVTACNLVGFYLLSHAYSGAFPRGPWFLAVASPGLLFLLAGLLTQSAQARH